MLDGDVSSEAMGTQHSTPSRSAIALSPRTNFAPTVVLGEKMEDNGSDRTPPGHLPGPPDADTIAAEFVRRWRVCGGGGVWKQCRDRVLESPARDRGRAKPSSSFTHPATPEFNRP